MNSAGRHQGSLPHTQTTWRLWHKLTKERKFIDTAAPLSQPKHVLCDTTAEGGYLHILIPKTTKQPKLPAQSHPTPAGEQAVECPHVHRQGRFPIQACGPAVPCGGRNGLAILSYCSGWGVGRVSVAWALVTPWQLWDSPGLKARIFTGSRGSRVYNSTPWSCSEHHPNWWLKFCPKIHPLGHR